MKAESSGNAPTVLMLTLLIALVSLGGQPACAAEKGFEFVPKWVRPGRSVVVKLGPQVDTTAKMYLRLSSRFTVKDIPLDNNQVSLRIIELKVPENMRPGTYEATLVDEKGKDLGASGSSLKIAASDKPEDKPVITKIVPVASYAKNDRYNFDIIGENIGDDVRGIKLLINDTAFLLETPQHEQGSKTSVKDCKEGVPCLVWNWRKLSIRSLSLKEQQITRPMHVSIEVDGIESNKMTIILSPVDRMIPAAIAFTVLGILTLLVHLMYRREASKHQVKGKPHFILAYLLIDPRTNTYSLSQLQLILWLAAAIVAYMYLAVSQALVQWNWKLCEIPENLPMLMGISVGTSVLSLGATGMWGSKGAGPVHPELGDFITSGGVFAPERLQFFLWTIIGVFGFVSATLAQDPSLVTDLPRIPDSFIPLMGLSSIGYLAGKVTRKPGPIISRLDPTPDVADGVPLHIIGENLSPRAQVILNGQLLPADAISVGPTAQADAEFVTEFIVTPSTMVPAVPGIAVVRIVNPDGQSAAI